MSDTRSVIADSIASMRQDSPADGGPDPVDTPDTGDGDTPEDTTVDDGPDPVDLSDEVPEPGDVTPENIDEKPVEKVEEPKIDEDDFSLVPATKKDKNGREITNSIPQPRVKKMVESSVKKAVEAERAQHTEKITGYESRLKQMDDLGSIMEADPDRFMSMLANVNPGYKAYAKGGAQPAAPERQAPAAGEPMPQPDSRLSDGTPAYSPEGFQKVQEWQARQVEERIMGKVSERYKWVDDARAAQEARDAAIPGIRAQMRDAQENWDGFQENYDAILGELRTDSEEAARTGRDPKLTLHDAYRRVMVGKHKGEREAWEKERETLKTDRNKVRDEVVKELNGRPRATATVPTTPVSAPAPGDDSNKSTRDIIRESIAKARRG